MRRMSVCIIFLLVVGALLKFETATADSGADIEIVPSSDNMEQQGSVCHCPVPDMTLEIPKKNNPGCEAKVVGFTGSTCFFDGQGQPCQAAEYTEPERTVKCGGVLNACDEEINPSPDWCSKAKHVVVKYRTPQQGCGTEVITEEEFTLDEAVDHCQKKAVPDEVLDFPCKAKETGVRADIINTEIVFIGCDDVSCMPGQSPDEACSQADCGFAVRCKDTRQEQDIRFESCKANESDSSTTSMTPYPTPTLFESEVGDTYTPTPSPTVSAAAGAGTPVPTSSPSYMY